VDFSPCSRHQLAAQILFQIFNRVADRRLGEVQFAGGFCEAAGLYQGTECEQLAAIDGFKHE
jgi:hypothetical protein